MHPQMTPTPLLQPDRRLPSGLPHSLPLPGRQHAHHLLRIPRRVGRLESHEQIRHRGRRDFRVLLRDFDDLRVRRWALGDDGAHPARRALWVDARGHGLRHLVRVFCLFLNSDTVGRQDL